MWKLFIDEKEIEDFYKSFPDKEEESRIISTIHTKLGDWVYRSKLPATLAWYRNLETNELYCKPFVLNNLLDNDNIPEDLMVLKKEDHCFFVSFSVIEDKRFVRTENLPIFVEDPRPKKIPVGL